MGSKKTKTTSNETAVTTPNTPAYAMPAITNYYQNTVPSLFDQSPTSVVPGLNGLQQTVRDKAVTGLGQTGAYGNAQAYVQNGLNRVNAVQPAQTATSSLPNAITAQQSALPAQYQTANVARATAPTVAKAEVAGLPSAYLASDSSGLADKAVNTFGGTSASGFIDQYMNPLLSDYVDATMADYWDNAGRQQAAYARKGAANKAFSDSRYGFGEAQLLSDLNRGAATTRAGLYSDAWNKALGAASGDADRGNAAGIASMQAQNDRDTLLAQLAQTYGLANADALNSFGMAGFNAQNTANLANAGAANDLASQAFGIEANANSQDAAAKNNALSQFYQGQLSNGQFNAGQANDLSSMLYQAGLQNNQFNTGQSNNMAQFNAGLAMDQGQAGINAGATLANILSQRGDSYRSDLGLMNDIGNSQWSIEQQQALEPYTKAGLLGEALNPQLLSLLTGQTINTNGTSTSKQSGGLLASILGPAAQLGAAAITKSERRVKRNIRHLGGEEDGLGVYAYNYVWDAPEEPLRIGVMVDEVARLRPWALGPIVDGVQTVDYSRLREQF